MRTDAGVDDSREPQADLPAKRFYKSITTNENSCSGQKKSTRRRYTHHSMRDSDIPTYEPMAKERGMVAYAPAGTQTIQAVSITHHSMI